MNDIFQQEIAKITKMEKLIKTDLSSWEDLTKKNKQTTMLDANIRNQLDLMTKNLKTLLFETTKSNKNNLSGRELNRRLEIIQDYEQITKKYKKIFEDKVLKTLEQNSSNSIFDNTSNNQINQDLINNNLTNKDLLKIQKDKIKEQDEALDEFHKLLKQSTRSNREMSNELEVQNPLLKNMDNQMDKVNHKLKKTQNRLNTYIEKSSSTCLMTTICLEILLFLIIISLI